MTHPQDQLKKLDDRLGVGVGAARERAFLKTLIDKGVDTIPEPGADRVATLQLVKKRSRRKKQEGAKKIEVKETAIRPKKEAAAIAEKQLKRALKDGARAVKRDSTPRKK